MADTNQSPFVAIIASPSATPYAYEPVVRAFPLFYDTVRMPEGRPERGRHGSTVGEVTTVDEKSLKATYARILALTGHLPDQGFLD